FQIGVLSIEAQVQGLAKTALPTPVTFEMILMPLIHTQGRVDRCLGAISRAFTPHVAADAVLDHQTLGATQLISPGGRAAADNDAFAADDAAVSLFPDRQAPLTDTVRSARIVRSKRRQFRVYDGGRVDTPPISLTLRDPPERS
ncbi:MAG: hypothetical protein AAGG99_08965, partial [Pseudomonadota bacterium]